MSFRLEIFLFMAVLVISTVAALPRSLLQRDNCAQACNAARSMNAARFERVINKEGPDICTTCRCSGEGWTLMHVAAQSDCHLCIDHLMAAPFNCPKMDGDADGNTILHIGAQFCRTTIVEEATDWYGLNIDLTNIVGDTALCIAASQNVRNCGGIVRNLIDGGANKCEACANGRTPCENSVHPHVRNVLEDEGACNCP